MPRGGRSGGYGNDRGGRRGGGGGRGSRGGRGGGGSYGSSPRMPPTAAPLETYMGSICTVLLECQEEDILDATSYPANQNILRRFATESKLRVLFVVRHPDVDGYANISLQLEQPPDGSTCVHFTKKKAGPIERGPMAMQLAVSAGTGDPSLASLNVSSPVPDRTPEPGEPVAQPAPTPVPKQDIASKPMPEKAKSPPQPQKKEVERQGPSWADEDSEDEMMFGSPPNPVVDKILQGAGDEQRPAQTTPQSRAKGASGTDGRIEAHRTGGRAGDNSAGGWRGNADRVSPPSSHHEPASGPDAGDFRRGGSGHPEARGGRGGRGGRGRGDSENSATGSGVDNTGVSGFGGRGGRGRGRGGRGPAATPDADTWRGAASDQYESDLKGRVTASSSKIQITVRNDSERAEAAQRGGWRQQQDSEPRGDGMQRGGRVQAQPAGGYSNFLARSDYDEGGSSGEDCRPEDKNVGVAKTHGFFSQIVRIQQDRDAYHHEWQAQQKEKHRARRRARDEATTMPIYQPPARRLSSELERPSPQELGLQGGTADKGQQQQGQQQQQQQQRPATAPDRRQRQQQGQQQQPQQQKAQNSPRHKAGPQGQQQQHQGQQQKSKVPADVKGKQQKSHPPQPQQDAPRGSDRPGSASNRRPDRQVFRPSPARGRTWVLNDNGKSTEVVP